MILVIDNYDSFTYNLVHYLNELGAETEVVRNDALTVQDALALRPKAVLLSPGKITESRPPLAGGDDAGGCGVRRDGGHRRRGPCSCGAGWGARPLLHGRRHAGSAGPQ